MYDKVFKNGLSKICEKHPLKNLKWPYHLNFFKGCLPQILHKHFKYVMVDIQLIISDRTISYKHNKVSFLNRTVKTHSGTFITNCGSF